MIFQIELPSCSSNLQLRVNKKHCQVSMKGEGNVVVYDYCNHAQSVLTIFLVNLLTGKPLQICCTSEKPL